MLLGQPLPADPSGMAGRESREVRAGQWPGAGAPFIPGDLCKEEHGLASALQELRRCASCGECGRSGLLSSMFSG